MKKRKMYRYLGRNGILTTRVLIEGANYIPLIELTADEHMILTNGERKAHSVVVEESDIDLWTEIADNLN